VVDISIIGKLNCVKHAYILAQLHPTLCQPPIYYSWVMRHNKQDKKRTMQQCC